MTLGPKRAREILVELLQKHISSDEREALGVAIAAIDYPKVNSDLLIAAKSTLAAIEVIDFSQLRQGVYDSIPFSALESAIGKAEGIIGVARPTDISTFETLVIQVQQANKLQHAGMKIPAELWSDLYDLSNRAQAILDKFVTLSSPQVTTELIAALRHAAMSCHHPACKCKGEYSGNPEKYCTCHVQKCRVELANLGQPI
jgi:hypothetical protein